jgi:glycosyltransferase involved in cell wall biosynthesis
VIIGIDARAYGWAGLGRYARNLLRHMTMIPSPHTFVVFAPRAFCRELADLPCVRPVPVTHSYYSVAEQTVFLASLLAERVDVMHFLHFNAPLFYRRPSVVTVHDLTRFFFPAQKRRGLLHQWAYEEVFRAAVEHAGALITVSEHTRRDLLRFFPQVSARTVVIREGVEHERFRPDPGANDEDRLHAFGVRAPYLLFVGVWMNHKNLPRLLQAFRLVRRRGFRGTLVLTGEGRKSDEDVRGMVRRLQLADDVVLPGIVPEDVLPSLYRRASAFVFPSLYEGFGLPPLEAMACGVPVVASRVASLPEVLGPAAEFVDPLSPEDIARGVRHVLEDQQHRQFLVARGMERARQFRWEQCAQETLQVYTSVVQEVSPVQKIFARKER